MSQTEKFYTTSQAIRRLERYPDRGYVFEAPETDDEFHSRLHSPNGRLTCETKLLSSWEFDSPTFRSDWRLVSPKRKLGRSVVVGEVLGGTVLDVRYRYGVNGQIASIPEGGRWRLIAVEVKE